MKSAGMDSTMGGKKHTSTAPRHSPEVDFNEDAQYRDDVVLAQPAPSQLGATPPSLVYQSVANTPLHTRPEGQVSAAPTVARIDAPQSNKISRQIISRQHTHSNSLHSQSNHEQGVAGPKPDPEGSQEPETTHEPINPAIPGATPAKPKLSPHVPDPGTSVVESREQNLFKGDLHGRIHWNVPLMVETFVFRSNMDEPALPDSTPPLFSGPEDYSDINFPNWFVNTVNSLVVGSPKASEIGDRVWVTTRSSGLQGSNAGPRKPGFVLSMQQHSTPDMYWTKVLVVGEHQMKGKSEASVFSRLAEHVSCVFAHQGYRLFVHGLLTYSDGTIRALVFDRAGVVGSILHGLADGQGSFLRRLVLSYRTMGLLELGFNTKGIVFQHGALHLQLNLPEQTADTVQLQETLFSRQQIIGRGTWCVRGVRSKGTSFSIVLVKFAWRLRTQISEGYLLHLATQRGAIGIAKYVAHQDVCNIKDDIRQGLPLPPPLYWQPVYRTKLVPESLRSQPQAAVEKPAKTSEDAWNYNKFMEAQDKTYHYLIVGTIGKPLCNVAAPKTLVKAFLGAFIGHASLFFTAKILHRDISPNNIMCLDPPQPPLALTNNDYKNNKLLFQGCKTIPQSLHGFMIDLDCASQYRKEGLSVALQRRGTLPFMAIGILDGEAHMYRHDLESFLYVLLWICIQGPASQNNPTSPHLRPWTQPDCKKHNREKYAQMTREKDFAQLLDSFHPSFVGLKGLVQDMWKVLFWVRSGPELRNAQPGYIKHGLTEINGYKKIRDLLMQSIECLEPRKVPFTKQEGKRTRENDYTKSPDTETHARMPCMDMEKNLDDENAGAAPSLREKRRRMV